MSTLQKIIFMVKSLPETDEDVAKFLGPKSAEDIFKDLEKI